MRTLEEWLQRRTKPGKGWGYTIARAYLSELTEDCWETEPVMDRLRELGHCIGSDATTNIALKPLMVSQ